MPENTDVIRTLNVVLRNELTAINQYFLHSRILRNAGFHTLAAKEYEESIDEMKHADQITQRILFLGGLPNFQDLGRLMIGETAEEMLRCDLAAEEKAVADLRVAYTAAENAADYVTSEMVRVILESEEEHILWLRQQLGIIGQIGIQNYLQSQM